tara:strand:- start:2902 stop:4905 length:2004 start_codon:yes stop_codon:yes gene_type:complete
MILNKSNWALLAPFLIMAWVAQAGGIIDTTQAVVALDEAAVIGVDFEAESLTDAPKSLTVLQPAEWQSSASITEALEFIPGVDVQSRGAWGIQTDISIRGGSFEQVALRVDGMRWSAPHTGHHLMNIPIDPEDLGHVEVVKSGAGPWAGVGAFSGAINMETNTGSSANRASFSAELGSFDWQRVRAHVDWNTASVSHGLSISRASTSGHISNSDATIQRLMYGWAWSTGIHRFKGLVAGETKAFGAQNFYSSVYPDQYEETGAAVAQVAWNMDRKKWRFRAGVHGRLHQDRFELYREGAGWYELTDDGFYVAELATPDTAALWYTGANLHRSLVGATNALAQWKSGNWTLSAAADARIESIRSNRLGQPLDGVAEDDPYVLGETRQNLDTYASAKWSVDKWIASATAGLNSNSRFGNSFIPAAQVVRKLGTHARVFASAGRSVRHPSFTDLYYNIGGAIGSDSLQSECSNQAEAGFRLVLSQSDASRIILEATRFYREGANLIDWIRYDGSSVFQAANLSRIEFQGGDLTVQYTATSSDAPRITMARLSATWMDADRASTGFTSNYVLDFVRTKYDAVCRIEGGSPLAFTLRGSMQERNGVAMQWEDTNLLQLWGVEVAFTGNDGGRLAWRGNVRLDNLFDVQYADRGSVLQPGRMVRFGLTFEWNE